MVMIIGLIKTRTNIVARAFSLPGGYCPLSYNPKIYIHEKPLCRSGRNSLFSSEQSIQVHSVRMAVLKNSIFLSKGKPKVSSMVMIHGLIISTSSLIERITACLSPKLAPLTVCTGEIVGMPVLISIVSMGVLFHVTFGLCNDKVDTVHISGSADD